MATALLVVIWCSVTAYALLAGADFGAGIWDLLAGPGPDGRRRRALMEHVIGPVWEANHVWLIFVLVLLWTCFPPVFSALASTLWVPLMLVALGVIGRGAAFAFRKAVAHRAFGVTFALSSLVTPFFLGALAGAIASDRVPPGIAAGAVLGSWLNPSSLLTGALAMSACAFLAAVYLTGDAHRAASQPIGPGPLRIGKQSKRARPTPLRSGPLRIGKQSKRARPTPLRSGPLRIGKQSKRATPTPLRSGPLRISKQSKRATPTPLRIRKQSKRASEEHPDVEWFRRRALAGGTLTGALSLAGLLVTRVDAPALYHGLTHRAWPLVVASAAAGLAALALVAARHYLAARAAAGLAVAAVVWGWGIARYPQLLPGLPVDQAHALPATLRATAIAVAVGLVLLVPSLALLLALFQRDRA